MWCAEKTPEIEESEDIPTCIILKGRQSDECRRMPPVHEFNRIEKCVQFGRPVSAVRVLGPWNHAAKQLLNNCYFLTVFSTEASIRSTSYWCWSLFFVWPSRLAWKESFALSVLYIFSCGVFTGFFTPIISWPTSHDTMLDPWTDRTTDGYSYI